MTRHRIWIGLAPLVALSLAACAQPRPAPKPPPREEPLSEKRTKPGAEPTPVHTCPPPQYGNRVVKGKPGHDDCESAEHEEQTE